MWITTSRRGRASQIYDFSLTNAGIPVFFLISGYFIPASFRGSNPVRNFIVRRGLRLYPVFLVAGLLALVLLPLESGLAVGPRGILRSFMLMDPVAPATPFTHIHWALMVLLGFYAMCIAAALLGCVHSRLYPAVAIAVLLAALAGMIVVGHLYHRHFPIAVMLALVLAHLGRLRGRPAGRDRSDRQDAGASSYRYCLCSRAAILLVSRFAWSTAWGTGELWIGKALGYALAIGLFLACAFDRLPGSRSFAALGALSYPLFFFLPLAIAFAAPHLMPLPREQRLLPLAVPPW